MNNKSSARARFSRAIFTSTVFVAAILSAPLLSKAEGNFPVVVGTPDPNPPAAVTEPSPSPSPVPALEPVPPAPQVEPPGQPVLPDFFGGGCAFKNGDKTCALSVELSVALALAAVDLKTGKYLGGPGALPQGICYGVTYQPQRWYASGASACLSVVAGTGTSTTITTSLSLSLLHFGAVGIASLCREGEERLYCHAILLFGMTVRAR